MPASGSSLFTDPEGYQAALDGMAELLVARPAEFRAQVSWMELPALRLIRAQESSQRVAYIALPTDFVFVSFPSAAGSVVFSGGTRLQYGNLLLHPPGDRLHQWTIAASQWGLLSIAPSTLRKYGEIIAGKALDPPTSRVLLRPLAADRDLLLRLHAEVGRLAKNAPARLGHKEVVRALEQDLILALVRSLVAGENKIEEESDAYRSSMMIRFEAALLANHPKILRTREISALLSISERALLTTCEKQLGMGPYRYQQLRRLKRMRAALLRTETAGPGFAELLRMNGFSSVHRFVTEYSNVYGERPPLPPHHATMQ